MMDPVRLCCGQRHTTLRCPDGLIMCAVCFDRFPVDQLLTDDEGSVWDICKGCEDR